MHKHKHKQMNTMHKQASEQKKKAQIVRDTSKRQPSKTTGTQNTEHRTRTRTDQHEVRRKMVEQYTMNGEVIRMRGGRVNVNVEYVQVPGVWGMYDLPSIYPIT